MGVGNYEKLRNRGRGRLRIGLVGVLLATIALGTAGLAGDFAIDWLGIDAGGGTSTNGQYSLTGTIGQPDAGGPMTNGTYAVTGGFWVLPVASDSTTPSLFIELGTPGFVTVGWTSAISGFALQSATNVALANWVDALTGTNNPVSLPIGPERRFFRLRKPAN